MIYKYRGVLFENIKFYVNFDISRYKTGKYYVLRPGGLKF